MIVNDLKQPQRRKAKDVKKRIINNIVAKIQRLQLGICKIKEKNEQRE